MVSVALAWFACLRARPFFTSNKRMFIMLKAELFYDEGQPLLVAPAPNGEFTHWLATDIAIDTHAPAKIVTHLALFVDYPSIKFDVEGLNSVFYWEPQDGTTLPIKIFSGTVTVGEATSSTSFPNILSHMLELGELCIPVKVTPGLVLPVTIPLSTKAQHADNAQVDKNGA